MGDFNSRGIRVGVRTSDDDFISAYWWDYQNDYIAIAKWKFVGNPEFSDELIKNIEPEWWTEMPEIQVDKLI